MPTLLAGCRGVTLAPLSAVVEEACHGPALPRPLPAGFWTPSRPGEAVLLGLHQGLWVVRVSPTPLCCPWPQTALVPQSIALAASAIAALLCNSLSSLVPPAAPGEGPGGEWEAASLAPCPEGHLSPCRDGGLFPLGVPCPACAQSVSHSPWPHPAPSSCTSLAWGPAALSNAGSWCQHLLPQYMPVPTVSHCIPSPLLACPCHFPVPTASVSINSSSQPCSHRIPIPIAASSPLHPPHR